MLKESTASPHFVSVRGVGFRSIILDRQPRCPYYDDDPRAVQFQGRTTVSPHPGYRGPRGSPGPALAEKIVGDPRGVSEMARRLVLALAWLVAAVGGTTRAAEPPRRPNILVILA